MENIVKEALKKYQGDGYLELHLENREFTAIEYSNEELEGVSRSNVLSGNMRLFEKGYWYFISFMDDDFKKHFATLDKMTKITRGQKGSISSYKKVIDKIKTSYVIDPREVPLSDKNDLIKKYNSIIYSNDKIQTSRALYRDVFKHSYFANTEGSYIEQESNFSGFSCSAVAKEGMNVQTSTYSNAGYGGFELVNGKEDEVKNVAGRAIEMLSAPQVKGGRYNVILDNRMAGVFAHEAFGHLSEADFIYENQDFQKIMKLGREFGSPEVNIVDDGSLEGLAGYTPYDDEGVKASRTHLIKNGKLNARLTSRETAHKLGEPLSGNARALSPYFSPIVRMTNTFIDKGQRSVEELFDMCGDGIYACGFIGGMTSLEQFTFTPKTAYLVENGKIKHPVRDAVLSGNVFETIASISGVGNDLMHFGTLGGCGKSGQQGLSVSTGGPHVFVKDVLVGGR